VEGTPETVDMTGMDDDDDDEDGSWTQEDFMPEERVLGKRKSASPNAEPGPACPICMKPLQAGASNQALNDHIDVCLNREAIVAAGGTLDEGSSTTKTKRPKKGATSTTATKGTMLNWLTSKK